MHAQLRVHALQVHLHGVAADPERRGDGRDAKPVGHQLQNLHFANGQGGHAAARVALDLAQRRTVSAVHFRDDAHEVVRPGALDDEFRHARVEYLVHGIALGAGVHDDPRARIDLADRADRLQAVGAPWVQAHDGDIRSLGDEAFEGACHRPRLGHDLHARLAPEDRDHAFTDQIEIVDAQHADSRAHHPANYGNPPNRGAKVQLSSIVSGGRAQYSHDGRLPVVLRRAPVGLDETTLLEALQRRVERPVIDDQHVVGLALDLALRPAVAGVRDSDADRADRGGARDVDSHATRAARRSRAAAEVHVATSPAVQRLLVCAL